MALAATSSLLATPANAAPANPCFADSTFVSLETELPVDPADSAPLLSMERTGAIPVKQGLRIRVNADPGNVHIFTDETTQVSYLVRVEADSREPSAREFLEQFKLTARPAPWGVSLEGNVPWREFGGRFRVVYEIHVPHRSNVEVHTLGGNIELQDLDGTADLSTEGGNITAGSVGLAPAAPSKSLPKAAANHVAAKLETMGGHIAIGDVAGTLRATTSGGHITAGNISGDAYLHTDGGLIRAGRISGAAELETGGGNIHVQSAASNVIADTAGGEIDFGETSGTIRARTGGGSLRIAHVTGATAVETSGGIFLGQVDAPLRVSSTSGNVTAWLADPSGRAVPIAAENSKNTRKLPEASQLSSDDGDIVVYIPREMAATIDAVVEERSGGHRIIADPSLPLQVSYQDSSVGPRSIHCAGELNGGGEVLHLRAVSGNIILRSGDPQTDVSAAPPMRRRERERGDASAMLAAASSNEPETNYDASGFFAQIRRMIAESWWGGVPVDADEMQQRLEHSVAPVYPDVARKAGIEGDVVLRVSISEDGRVTNLEVLDGPPVLARAAVNAVRQWRYRAWIMNGHPAAVVTTLVVSFRLH
ncbi:MAG: TonB family protein [Acidobacteriia bacterium]|nr:TonB family protein [Terriglobia bacterium]